MGIEHDFTVGDHYDSASLFSTRTNSGNRDNTISEKTELER
jgi:hypothetical protein